MVMLYFSSIFRSEAGIPNAREFSNRLIIISERLRKHPKRVEMVQVRQENKGVGVPFVILNQLLLSRFLFIGSGRLATLNDDTVLILRFARSGEKFRQMRDIAIKLLQLVRKRIRLGARCEVCCDQKSKTAQTIHLSCQTKG